MTEPLDLARLAEEIEQAVEAMDVERINELRARLAAHLDQQEASDDLAA